MNGGQIHAFASTIIFFANINNSFWQTNDRVSSLVRSKHRECPRSEIYFTLLLQQHLLTASACIYFIFAHSLGTKWQNDWSCSDTTIMWTSRKCSKIWHGFCVSVWIAIYCLECKRHRVSTETNIYIRELRRICLPQPTLKPKIN